jgi:hypothetical protein
MHASSFTLRVGRAIAQAVSRWLPIATARVRYRSDTRGIFGGQSGRLSPSTSVYPANHHSTKFSILIFIRGMYNGPIGGRRAEWTQLDSIHH